MLTTLQSFSDRFHTPDQKAWLGSALAWVQELAEKHRASPWVHDIICENFWPSFIRELSRKTKSERWSDNDFVVIRELVRISVHKSFAKVGQWVDEWPILGWQMAKIEQHILGDQIQHCTRSPESVRL